MEQIEPWYILSWYVSLSIILQREVHFFFPEEVQEKVPVEKFVAVWLNVV